MKAIIKSLVNYIDFYLSSKTTNSLHSPMVYELITHTIEDNREYYAFRELEAMRQQLLRMDKMIEITDLGAGSKVDQSKYRKVSDIAKTALSPEHKAKFLFRLSKHIQPKHILELGTSLGLSALYMYRGCSSAKLTTIEGDPNVAQIAKEMFLIEKTNINLIQSSFDEALASSNCKDEVYQLIYIDGNHTREATLKYVAQLKLQLDDGGVIILDDIYWSDGMKSAWKELKEDKDFGFSVDLFHYGLLVKKANHKHQSFKIVSRKAKPWNLGLWG